MPNANTHTACIHTPKPPWFWIEHRPHECPVLMKPKILISSKWPYAVSSGPEKKYCQITTIWLSWRVGHNMYQFFSMCKGCFGRSSYVQTPSDHIKSSINISQCRICAGHIIIMSVCVSYFESIHLAGITRCSTVALLLKKKKKSMHKNVQHTHIDVCVRRWVRGWFTVAMCTIVTVPWRQVAWLATYFIKGWLKSFVWLYSKITQSAVV